MKKIMLAVGIPALAAVSLIGSGFATWYLDNSTQNSNTLTINTATTDEAKAGKFEEVNNAKLILDQSKSSEGSDAKDSHRWGIGFWKSETLSSDQPTSAADGVVTLSYKYDSAPTVSKVKFVTTFTISKDISSYVTLAFRNETVDSINPRSSFTSNNLTYTYTISEDKVTANKETKLFDLNWLTVEYVSEPTSTSSYSSMKEVMKDVTFTVTSTATIVE